MSRCNSWALSTVVLRVEAVLRDRQFIDTPTCTRHELTDLLRKDYLDIDPRPVAALLDG
jgi:hypothetical protein